MTIRCPNCQNDFSVKEIVAEERWHEEDGETVRDVILRCPGCKRALRPDGERRMDAATA